jgi:hypothetical protein
MSPRLIDRDPAPERQRGRARLAQRGAADGLEREVAACAPAASRLRLAETRADEAFRLEPSQREIDGGETGRRVCRRKSRTIGTPEASAPSRRIARRTRCSTSPSGGRGTRGMRVNLLYRHE